MASRKKEESVDTTHGALLNAANSQGFLLQDLVLHEARKGFEDHSHRLRWVLEAREYPVRASDDSETKIDLVLSHKDYRGAFLTLECKRAHPDYKAWVFFGNHGFSQTTSSQNVYAERLVQQTKSTWDHTVHRTLSPVDDMEFFSYYLEARIDENRKAAGTETIENAFTQVIRGQSGLVTRALRTPPSNQLLFLPIVVTTAQLYRLSYDAASIALRDATLDSPSSIDPLPWCGVTYHASTKLKIASDHVKGETSGSSDRLERDIRSLYARTIYVVQVEHLRNFLFELGQSIDAYF